MSKNNRLLFKKLKLIKFISQRRKERKKTFNLFCAAVLFFV